jgi:hypothetical protein
MYWVDVALSQLASRIGGTYTRYADDLYFSTSVKGGCRAFANEVESVLQEEVTPALSLNRSKTFFMSRGTKRMITGIVACPNGSVSIGRKRKRYIRKLLNDLRFGAISTEDRKTLQGYLGFALDVEPDFYNRLATKKTYGAALVRLALTDPEGSDE